MRSTPLYESHRSTGFGLIEVLSVLAIIGILATVALPTYRQAVVQVRRSEGQSALLRSMQQQEQIYTQRTAYLAFSAGSTDPDARRFKWYSGESAATSAYEIEAEACPNMQLAECVLIRARPGTVRVNQSYRDQVCGTLWLDSFGKQGADAENCW